MGSGQVLLAEFVRFVERGESVRELIEFGKAITWVTEKEHAVVSLAGGDLTFPRAIVSGGRDGIAFPQRDRALWVAIRGQMYEIQRILGHTHPRATGPSQEDFEILKLLGQRRSYIIEIGGEPNGSRFSSLHRTRPL